MEKYLLELLEQENFDFNKSNNDEIEKIKNAIDKAWETRDFEIKLYWQRALYFWGFIALAFYAPFAILNLEQDFISYPIINKFFFVTIVCILGSFLSFAWYLANRGSKYWQENWERWINILEKYKYGKLYSTTFDEKDIDWYLYNWSRKIFIIQNKYNNKLDNYNCLVPGSCFCVN